jgi:ABC-2 type transport system permease protein
VSALRRACRAEWTKLRTQAGPLWLLLALAVATPAVGAAVAGSVPCSVAGCAGDPARLALSGVTVGQAAAALLAVLAVCGEYGTGLIHLTLAAVPARTTVLAAKAAVVAAAVGGAGILGVGVSLAAGHALLPGGPPFLTDGPTVRAATGSVLYLVLVALLALGTAFCLREAAAAAATVLALLYLFPLLAHVVTSPRLQRRLARIGPMPAGLAVQSTTAHPHLPIGPWPGLGVLALWATAALLLAAAALRGRDA